MENNFMQVVEMTDEEQTEMYLKQPKREIILMLIEANKQLKNLSRIELPVKPEIAEEIDKEALEYANKQVNKIDDCADLNERWFERYNYLLNNFNHYRK